MNPILLLDYAGVAVFAATGALAASRKQLDIIGFLFLASVTGIGGGTFRDLILGAPVFWVANPAYVLVSAAIGVLVFFTAHLVESRYKLLLWLDAVGLAAYAVMGAAKGMAATGSPTVAIVTGMLTATFGGILRDIIAGEPSVLLRPEIYVTAAMTRRSGFHAGRSCRPRHACGGSDRLYRGHCSARRRDPLRLDFSGLSQPPRQAAGRHPVITFSRSLPRLEQAFRRLHRESPLHAQLEFRGRDRIDANENGRQATIMIRFEIEIGSRHQHLLLLQRAHDDDRVDILDSAKKFLAGFQRGRTVGCRFHDAWETDGCSLQLLIWDPRNPPSPAETLLTRQGSVPLRHNR